MARVTVEDCVLKVPNRFDLVMMSAQRAREVSAGATLTMERDNDKNPVVALREIAAETVPLDGLKESLIRGHQRHSSLEDEEPEEVIELMAGEREGAEGLGPTFGADTDEAAASADTGDEGDEGDEGDQFEDVDLEAMEEPDESLLREALEGDGDGDPQV